MADIIPFHSKANLDREALIKSARETYESVFPSSPKPDPETLKLTRARIDAIRKRYLGGDLVMDHADKDDARPSELA